MRTLIFVVLCGLAAAANIKKRAGGCAYKGQVYQQTQTWTDGCLYNCVCQDAATGRYQCTDICPKYDNLPAGCTLVTPAGKCCGEPKCNFQTSGGATSGSGTGTLTLTGGSTGTGMTGSGGCTNTINNCDSYGKTVCSDTKYATWVQANCCAYCSGGMSTGTGGSMIGTGTGGSTTGTGSGTSGGDGGFSLHFIPGTGSGVGTGTGTGTGMTGTGTGMTGTGTGMTGGSCTDAIPNCAAYTKSVCSDANYAPWVAKNCCAYCSGTGGSMTGTGTGTGTGGTGTGGTLTGTGSGGSVVVGMPVPNTGSGGTPVVAGMLAPNTGTGGSMTGTGGTGTGGTGTGSGGTPVVAGMLAPNTGTGGSMTGTGTGGMTSGSCTDKIATCANYGQATCNDANYNQWVMANCPAYCHKCQTGTGGMTGTGTGGMTGTGTGGMTGTGTGGMTGTGACADSLPNCSSYSSAVCTDYRDWAATNCQAFCHMCSGTGTGMTGTGTGMTGTGTGMTGTGMTGTGTGMTGGCVDKATSCALMQSSQNICSDSSARIYAQENCARTCGMCSGGSMTGGTITGGGNTGGMTGGTMTGTGTCADAIANCAAYTNSVCTDQQYATWATKNCAKFCNKCGSSGTMTGTGTGMTGTGTGMTGTGTGMTGTGTGMTGTGTGMTGTGTGMTGTGTGTGTGMTGQSSGCVYQNNVYTQGQTWKDGCKYKCTCVDASSGKYSCSQMCVTWQLPQQCHLDPAPAGKCCSTPNCPAGFNVQYPAGYHPE